MLNFPQSSLIERGLNVITQAVERLQELEKEKLMVTAASHMDSVQEKYNIFQNDKQDVLVLPQSGYTSNRIDLIAEEIREVMEIIQAEKCELHA